MSLVRVSTTGPEQTCSLWNLLAKRGLNVVILSATELGVECEEELSENLSRELEWARAQVQGNVPAGTISPSLSLEGQSPGNEIAPAGPGDADWMEGYVPEREFILAPYWRRIRAALASLLEGFSRTDKLPSAEPASQDAAMPASWSARFTNSVEFARDAIKHARRKLRRAEERILEESQAGDLRRENAEAGVWDSESEDWASAPKTAGRFFNVKIFAFLGGAAMAGLILLGLSLAHRSGAPLTIESADSPASNASQPVERPAAAAASAQSAKPVAESAVATKAVKPSPSKSVQSAGNLPAARPRVKRSPSGALDDQEVITRYYRRNAPRVNRASYDGVKHYSDLN